VGTRRQATKEQSPVPTEEKPKSGVGMRAALKKLNPFRRKSDAAQTVSVTK
jgi:hypothetical protein